MILAVAPSITHCTVESGPIDNCFRTCEGTETWPRLETLVRIRLELQESCMLYKATQPLACNLCSCTRNSALSYQAARRSAGSGVGGSVERRLNAPRVRLNASAIKSK